MSFIEGLVSEVVVIDGIDTGILGHIGLLCMIERVRGTGSVPQGI
jgi:hypothetical protein